MCVASMHSSFQYSDEGPDGNYANGFVSVKVCPNNCACYDRHGKIYNLAPLQATNGTPRFGKHYYIKSD